MGWATFWAIFSKTHLVTLLANLIFCFSIYFFLCNFSCMKTCFKNGLFGFFAKTARREKVETCLTSFLQSGHTKKLVLLRLGQIAGAQVVKFLRPTLFFLCHAQT
jgi:hypothetical protein